MTLSETREARNRAGRRWVFVIAIWLAVFASAELLAQLAFQLLPGSSPVRRLANPKRFNIHRFTHLVGDDRVAVLTPGFRGEVLIEVADGERRRWYLEIDQRGFRSGTDNGRRGRQVIAFVGDSVPFGWGIPDEATVPSRFEALLHRHGLGDMGVLNAAVPSYTLHQAVEHFQRVVAGRYPLHSVVFQTFDPALQFSILGENWNPRISSATRSRDSTRPLLGPLEALLDKSVLFGAGLRLAYSAAQPSSGTGPITDAAWQRFDQANTNALVQLAEAARRHGARLLIVAVNPGPDPDAEYTDRERQAIGHFNELLANFAATQAGVDFFDVAEVFRAHPARAALFLDPCCHLSEQGARVQAEQLLEWYMARQLLDRAAGR